MGLLDLASYQSVWRGYEYFDKKYVITRIKESDTEFRGMVHGSGQKHYDVFIDLEHPRKSKCNCPHADGKRIICKHMIALFFSAFPNEAQKYYESVIKYQEEEEQRQEELEYKVMDYIHKLKKSELEQALLQILFDGPEWQYDKFIREYIER
ncbi:MAG: SWIM zinc finger family protein [Acutalibacteraceae bacterium]|nr:SWIM zinc finger family protein [Acutalibacteraceae bacterium]